MNTRSRISWNLRRLRTSRNVTQEILAVDADVDRTVISDIERGQHNASVDLLERLTHALGCDISELFIIPAPTDAEPRPLAPGRKANDR